MAEHTPTERRAQFDRWLAEFNRWLTEARHEAAAGTNIADMRSDEDRATVRAIRDRAARRDNPLPKGDDMTDFNLSREAVRAACRAVHPTRWEYPATARSCDDCTTAVTAAGPLIAAEALREAAPGCNCEDDYARLNDRADRIEKEARRG